MNKHCRPIFYRKNGDRLHSGSSFDSSFHAQPIDTHNDHKIGILGSRLALQMPRASIGVKWRLFIVSVNLVVNHQAVYRIKIVVMTHFFHVKYPYHLPKIESIYGGPENLSMTSLPKPEVAY